ncbi:MAG: prolyl oligopeptidase family serine peptidase [Clostridiales bacterium]|nr:prolyl oligopeptidase family serine peptidase [Clostridiales bacterium]
MHVLDVTSHQLFKNNVKQKIYDTFKEELLKRRNISSLKEWMFYQKKIMEVFNAAFPEEMFVKLDKIKFQVVKTEHFEHFSIENVNIESVLGWFVNATVYRPSEKGTYYGIVCPTGHSSKTKDNYVRSNQALARNGYITISFDPPGMKGEHQFGNDHFTDGVLSFLSGFWSNTYFVLDAIRCIDYLETRDDIIKGSYGMTGISGGGTTTMYASIIDNRIKACAPVCCVSNSLHHLLEENYTTCPETIGFNYYKHAIDFEMLLSLCAPTPLLLVGGKNDEILNYQLAIETMKHVQVKYKLYGKENLATIYIDPNAGHEYTLKMIEKVAIFFNKYLKKEAKKAISLLKEDILYINQEKLLCYPPDKTCFQSKNKKQFLINNRCFTEKDINNWVHSSEIFINKLTTTTGDAKWAYKISRQIYETNEQMKLPAILLANYLKPTKEVLLFFTDNGKTTHFINEGFLAKTAGMVSSKKQQSPKDVISVDLSGFGELEIEKDGYDFTGWCSQIRNVSYALLFYGSSVIEQRVKEIMAIIKYISKNKQYKKITLCGKGKASIPVLLAAYLSKNIEKTILIDLPISFETMTMYVPNYYLPDNIIYDAPNKFELYEVVNKLKNITLFNPRYGDMNLYKTKKESIYQKQVKIIISESNDYEI